ncbi:MAG TPA: RraA family protein [Opitutaceae bacterium]|nr:RraA family protein [Opitutaceae bacterium]
MTTKPSSGHRVSLSAEISRPDDSANTNSPAGPTPSPAAGAEWQSDAELFAVMGRELYTPVVGDILDALGQYHRFLPAGIQPMRESMFIAGRAMPVLMIDVHGPQVKPFGLLTEALDDLRPGEVYVCGGGAMRCAYWGELLTATARTLGAVGAVIDGYHRDTPQVLEQGWPVFSRGRYAQDSSVRTAVAAFRCPIEIAGVWIEPGDLVFGDLDGVVIVPRVLETEVIRRALAKARGEKVVRRAIEGGMSATAAFREFGIL